MKQNIILPKSGDNRDRAGNVIKKLPADRAWLVEISEYKPRRSEQQNRYLFGICYPTILEQGGEPLRGWNKEDLHEFFLERCFGNETLVLGGKQYTRPLHRSSRLNKQEFSDFIAYVQHFASELGIFIPDPETY